MPKTKEQNIEHIKKLHEDIAYYKPINNNLKEFLQILDVLLQEPIHIVLSTIKKNILNKSKAEELTPQENIQYPSIRLKLLIMAFPAKLQYEVLGIDSKILSSKTYEDIQSILQMHRRALLSVIHPDINQSELSDQEVSDLIQVIENSFEMLTILNKIKDINDIKFCNKKWIKSAFILPAAVIINLFNAPLNYIIAIPAAIKEIFNTEKEKIFNKGDNSKTSKYVHFILFFVLNMALDTLIIRPLSMVEYQLLYTLEAIIFLPVALFILATTPFGVLYEVIKFTINYIKNYLNKDERLLFDQVEEKLAEKPIISAIVADANIVSRDAIDSLPRIPIQIPNEVRSLPERLHNKFFLYRENIAATSDVLLGQKDVLIQSSVNAVVNR